MRRFLRLGLPALAVYALVLQAFLAGAAPAAAFDPVGAPLCSELAATPDLPAPTHPAGHDHDCLVLSQCAAHGAAAALIAPGSPAPASLEATVARHAFWSGETGAAFTPHRGPGARAPPQG